MNNTVHLYSTAICLFAQHDSAKQTGNTESKYINSCLRYASNSTDGSTAQEMRED